MSPATLDTTPTGFSIRLSPMPTGEVLGEVWFPWGKGGGSTIAPDERQARARLEEIIADHERGGARV